MLICKQCNTKYDDAIAKGVCPHCGAIFDEMLYEHNAEKRISSAHETIDPRWLPQGTLLNGRYRLEKVLGTGGFGITYKAYDETTGAYKAIKEYFQTGVVNRSPKEKEVIIAAPKRREEFEYGKNRLLNEAKIVAKFQAPGIVRVDDYFEENGTSYMVMEYIDKPTLQDYLLERHKVLSPEEAVEIGIGLCESLEVIHSGGVIHRDIAPDNIFVMNSEDMRTKIVDFGSARLSKEDTDERLIVLKPGFAPPEQYEKIDIHNDKQKEWTDIYALGATLYLGLTGVIPIESSNRKTDADKGQDPLKEPKEINPNIPDWLNNAIMTAMAIDVHERFKNSSEFKAALLQKRKVISIENARRRKRIKRTTSIAVSFALALVMAALGWHRFQTRRESAVLKPAKITVWYLLNDNEATEAKDNKMNSIKEMLMASDRFADVDMEFVGYPQSEYRDELEKASRNGNIPNLFEYPGEDGAYMEGLLDTEKIIAGKSSEMLLTDNRKSVYESYNRIPTAFNVPIVYVNSSIAPDFDKDRGVSKLSDLFYLKDGNQEFSPFLIKEELVKNYEKMLPDLVEQETKLDSDNALEKFIEGTMSAVYFGDSSDYFIIQDKSSNSFKMIPLDVEEIVCTYSNEWCMHCEDKDADAAAKEILNMLVSETMQEIMYVQNPLPGIPLNRTEFAVYRDEVEKIFKEILSDDRLEKCTITSIR